MSKRGINKAVKRGEEVNKAIDEGVAQTPDEVDIVASTRCPSHAMDRTSL